MTSRTTIGWMFPNSRLRWSDGTSNINNNPNAIDWYPANPVIATVLEAWANFQVQFHSPGTTLLDATMPNECAWEYDDSAGDCNCAFYLQVSTQVPAQVTVKPTVTINPGDVAVPLAAAGFSGVTRSIQRSATGSPAGGSYSWTTTSNKIALSNTTSQTVTITSVSQSNSKNDVTVRVTYTKNGQSATAEITLTVVKPATLQAQWLPSGTYNCQAPSGCTSCLRLRRYYIKDQFGDPFAWPAVKLREEFSGFSSNCAGVTSPPPASDTMIRNADNFDDGFWLCSSSCPNCSAGAPGCQASASQKWFVNEFQVGSFSVTWNCSTASVSP